MPQETDDTKVDSSSTDENKGGSSTAEESTAPDAKGPTMLDVAREAAKQSLARVEDAEIEGSARESGKTEEAEDEPEKPGESEEKPAEEEESPEVEKPDEEEESPEEKPEDEDKSPPPFDKHPAWIKRTQKFQEAQAKVAELDTKVKELEPQAKSWDYHTKFMDQYGIPQQEVDQMMSFLALVRTNPAQAREVLKPMWEQLTSVDPNTLPQELQDAVKAGDMTEDYARRLWKAEATGKSSAVAGKFSAQKQLRDEQKTRDDAISSWDALKRKTDPDFAPKVKGAKNGLWEEVSKGYTYLKVIHPPRTVAEELGLLEQAYTEAKEYVASLRSPIRPSRTIASSKVSGKARNGAPKDIDGVVAAVAREHGIEWSGRGKRE